MKILNRVGLVEQFDLNEVAGTQVLVHDTNNNRLQQGFPDLLPQYCFY